MKKCYQQSIDEVVQYSKTDLKIGLSSPEVKKRLENLQQLGLKCL